jgi:hypothetical protein
VVKKLPFLFIIFLICGCSSSKKTIQPYSYIETPVVTGSLINHAAFERGGTLGLGLFRPGSGAAANEETDRLSSMLIKGVKEALQAEKTHFTILDDPKNSDCLLEGYIEEYSHKGRFSHLSVDGEIWLQETGERIFLFQTSVMINNKKQDPIEVAYQMGLAIAHFIGKDHK